MYHGACTNNLSGKGGGSGTTNNVYLSLQGTHLEFVGILADYSF